MLQKRLKDKKTFFLLLFCISVLALLRNYESVLFYDPFLDYFKNGYLNLPLPEFDGFKLAGSMFARYFLNTCISLVLLFLLFKDVLFLRFVSFLYGIFFVLLIFVFFYLIVFTDESNNFLLFYVRRFLIQPLFLMLFIPAFYLQKKES